MSFSEEVTSWTLAGNLSSHNSTADENWEWEAASITSMVIFTLTVLLGVPGNGTVIWVLGFKMKCNVHTVCFLNLAMADLIYCLTLPFSTVNISLAYSGYEPYFNWKLINVMLFVNGFASIYLLCLISIYRCLAITRPIWFRQHLSLTWVHAACFGVWILVFLVCLTFLMLEELEEFTVLEPFWLVFIYVLPLLIMITCYSLAVCRLQGDRFAKSKKPVRLIITVVAAFMICWIPCVAEELLSIFATPIPWNWFLFTVALTSLNSALNPLLYVFIGSKFRQVIKSSLLSSLLLAFAEQRPELGTQSWTPSRTLNTNV